MAWNNFYIAAGAAKLLGLPFLPLHGGVEGARHIPAGGCIIAANHSGSFDAALLVLACAEAKRAPLHMVAPAGAGLGWFLRSAGAVSPQVPEAALGWLAAGGAVGVFPEGGVNVSPALRRAEPLAALLALESGVPVIPAAVFPAGQPVRVRFGRSVPLMEKELRYASLPRDERASLIGNVGYRIMRAIGLLAGRECAE